MLLRRITFMHVVVTYPYSHTPLSHSLTLSQPSFCLTQVLVTPHSAFLTHEALANIAATTVQNITEFVTGEPLTNELKPRPKE